MSASTRSTGEPNHCGRSTTIYLNQRVGFQFKARRHVPKSCLLQPESGGAVFVPRAKPAGKTFSVTYYKIVIHFVYLHSDNAQNIIRFADCKKKLAQFVEYHQSISSRQEISSPDLLSYYSGAGLLEASRSFLDTCLLHNPFWEFNAVPFWGHNTQILVVRLQNGTAVLEGLSYNRDLVVAFLFRAIGRKFPMLFFARIRHEAGWYDQA